MEFGRFVLAFCLALTFTPAIRALAGPSEGPSVVVVTSDGKSLAGTFLGATASELTLQSRERVLTLSLREVSYISFSGRPSWADPVSYAAPTTPTSQLRAAAWTLESNGNLHGALDKYLEALKLGPTDQANLKAVDRVRLKIQKQEASERAAPYKKLALALVETKRYEAASACYDVAIGLDPYDEVFRDKLKANRHYWEPTTCPLEKAPGN